MQPCSNLADLSIQQIFNLIEDLQAEIIRRQIRREQLECTPQIVYTPTPELK